MVVLSVVLALTGCAAAAGAPSSALVTGSYIAGSPQTRGPVAHGNARLSTPSAVGVSSFPRSFLIPGTDTSIGIGGY
jgi:hypothetical protein